jgi:phosphatidylglycerophosphate synthase
MAGPIGVAIIMWITWANLLTLIRLSSAIPCAWAIGAGAWPTAALLFAIAVITDLLDGPVARHFRHVSQIGGLLDHATDAIFVSISLGALAVIGSVNVLLPVLVAAAFLQYVLDSRALAGRHLRTSVLGRANGIAYFVLVGIPVVRNALGLEWPASYWIQALSWLLTATTLLSMGDRLLALVRTR